MLITESRELQLEDLLDRIGAQLQITPSQHQQAEERYQAVANWLEAEGSPIAGIRQAIYPQGSLAIGTTVKPLAQEEYDLDLVLEVSLDWRRITDPTRLLRAVESRLRQHRDYSQMLELKNRCVRLNYANEFHLDILPACPDPTAGPTCVVVPDQAAREWKPSNPKGFAGWFDRRARLSLKTVLAEAERLPGREPLEQKPPLKRAVQLLKRWRDSYYSADANDAPVSIVLTTLAGMYFAGENSVHAGLETILEGIIGGLPAAPGRLVVVNPMNPQEDLSEKWASRSAYNAFGQGIRELNEDWKEISRLRGIDEMGARLSRLFGERPVRLALAEQAGEIQELRKAHHLGTRRGAAVIASVVTPGVSKIPGNTFYGE